MSTIPRSFNLLARSRCYCNVSGGCGIVCKITRLVGSKASLTSCILRSADVESTTGVQRRPAELPAHMVIAVLTVNHRARQALGIVCRFEMRYSQGDRGIVERLHGGCRCDALHLILQGLRSEGLLGRDRR